MKQGLLGSFRQPGIGHAEIPNVPKRMGPGKNAVFHGDILGFLQSRFRIRSTGKDTVIQLGIAQPIQGLLSAVNHTLNDPLHI